MPGKAIKFEHRPGRKPSTIASQWLQNDSIIHRKTTHQLHIDNLFHFTASCQYEVILTCAHPFMDKFHSALRYSFQSNRHRGIGHNNSNLSQHLRYQWNETSFSFTIGTINGVCKPRAFLTLWSHRVVRGRTRLWYSCIVGWDQPGTPGTAPADPIAVQVWKHYYRRSLREVVL